MARGFQIYVCLYVNVCMQLWRISRVVNGIYSKLTLCRWKGNNKHQLHLSHKVASSVWPAKATFAVSDAARRLHGLSISQRLIEGAFIATHPNAFVNIFFYLHIFVSLKFYLEEFIVSYKVCRSYHITFTFTEIKDWIWILFIFTLEHFWLNDLKNIEIRNIYNNL